MLYLFSMVGNDDDGAAQDDPLAEGDVAGHGQVIQIQDVRDGLEAPGEFVYLSKKIPRLIIMLSLYCSGRRIHPLPVKLPLLPNLSQFEYLNIVSESQCRKIQSILKR